MVAIRRPLLLIVGLAALLGAGPLWPWLDLPMRLLLPTALLYGALCEGKGLAPPPSRLATVVALAGFAWYALRFSRTEIVAPAVHLLAVLLALRLVTEKSARNLLQLLVLAILALAASSLYSLSSAFLVFLCLEVVCVALGLVLLSFCSEDPLTTLDRPAFRRLLGVGLALPLVSLLLVPPLFLILPRTQTPLWRVLNQAGSAVSGATDRIEPGAISALAKSQRLILRAEGPALSNADLYWRTLVLNTPDGKAWVRRPPPEKAYLPPTGMPAVLQRLYVEPAADRFIPILDAPVDFTGVRAGLSADGLLIAQRPIVQRLTLQVTSSTGARLRLPPSADAGFYLTLPTTISPRLRATAETLRAGGQNARDRLALAERFLLGQGLTYSQTDLPGGQDALDDFLFVKKSGYCEHFATAFTVLLRLAGVPSRLVGGYYGGDYNDLGGYYVVREAMAHVWVEALLDGRWERFDPTQLARNSALVGGGAGIRLQGLRQWLDAANYYWNRTVINYDLAQQIAWLRQTETHTRNWRVAFNVRQLLRQLLIPALLLSLGVGLFFLLRRSPLERLLRRFYRLLRRHGIEPEEHLGLQALAERYPHPAAQEFAALYNAIIFSDRTPQRAELRQLRALLRRCAQSSRP